MATSTSFQQMVPPLPEDSSSDRKPIPRRGFRPTDRHWPSSPRVTPDRRYAVNWLIGHSNRFKAAVSHDGVFNLESMALATEELWFPEWEFGGPAWSPKARENFARWSPHLHADRMRTPTLVITNELDFRVPVDQGLQLFTALRRNGVPAEPGVSGRRTLGTEGAEQQALARRRLRLDEPLSPSNELIARR